MAILKHFLRRVISCVVGGKLSTYSWKSAACCLLLTISGCGGGRMAVTPISSNASIWFHPLQASVLNGTALGSSDFDALFQPNAPWPKALAGTRVIGLYAGWVASVSDQELQTVVAFINAHNLGI